MKGGWQKGCIVLDVRLAVGVSRVGGCVMESSEAPGSEDPECGKTGDGDVFRSSGVSMRGTVGGCS
jgi:hypothetical protein